MNLDLSQNAEKGIEKLLNQSYGRWPFKCFSNTISLTGQQTLSAGQHE